MRSRSSRLTDLVVSIFVTLHVSLTPTQGMEEPPEWTLEQARQCWQTMVRPVQHVGVPGYQFQTAVLWDGALVFGPLDFRQLKVMQAELAPLGETRLHISVAVGEPLRFLDRKGTGHPSLRRFLEEGRLPIPHIVMRDGDLEWDERVFAHLLDRNLDDSSPPRADDILVTQLEFTVRNLGAAERNGHLWLHLGDTCQVQFGYKCAQKDDLSPAIAHRFEAPFGFVGDQVRYVLPAPTRGQVQWHEEAPAPLGTMVAARRVLEWRVTLAPGGTASLHVTLPYGPVSREVAQRLTLTDPSEQLARARRYWRRVEHGPGQILTPDPFVNDYLAAVAGQMAQQVACRQCSRIWMYKTSPNHYEGYWPCNAAKALPALDFRGLTALSRPVLASFVAQQTNDVRGMDRGAMGREERLPGEGYAPLHGFLGNFGEWTANPLLLSHGLGLWALATHYRITRDDRWLGRGAGSPLQAMLDGCDWVSAQRRRTMREVEGKQVEHWGLLPAASAHDWLAGNTIFNDAACIYGMAEVARVLREISHPRAEGLARELADYRACLCARYRAARDHARPLPLADGTSIPYVPRMVQELDWAKPDWTYTCFGPLRAGAWGALNAHDELVNHSLAFLEAGMPRGQGAYFSAHRTAQAEAGGRRPSADINWGDISDPTAERHYLWRHYVEYETMWPIGGPLFLARDELPRYFEWLFHNLAVAVHADWRVGVESLDGVPSCAPGDGERWQCIRKMFVHERASEDGSAESLWLLQAVPRSWLKPGARLAVRDMGTLFGGRINLEATVSPDGTLAVDTQWRDFAVLPSRILMRLRTERDRRPSAIHLDGRRVQLLPGDVIELPRRARGHHHVAVSTN